jgi:hypothetical protein
MHGALSICPALELDLQCMAGEEALAVNARKLPSDDCKVVTLSDPDAC